MLEDPEFFDDLSALQEGAKSRPLNLVVNLVYTLRDLVTTLSLVALLASLTWWIPLVLLLSVWPHAHMTLRLREIGWRALISRSPEARRLEYDSRVALSYDFALETRLFGLFPWLRERYSAIFERSHRTMRRVRARQAASLVPSSLLSIVVAGGLFGWVILQAGLGAFTLGGIVVVVQGLYPNASPRYGSCRGVWPILRESAILRDLLPVHRSHPLATTPSCATGAAGTAQASILRERDIPLSRWAGSTLRGLVWDPGRGNRCDRGGERSGKDDPDQTASAVLRSNRRDRKGRRPRPPDCGSGCVEGTRCGSVPELQPLCLYPWGEHPDRRHFGILG